MSPAVTPFSRRIPSVLSGLAIVGILVSSMSLQHHFAKSKTSYCDFGESFNCDTVNRSQYSTVAGIPVAGIGIAGYAIILLLATRYRRNPETPGMLTFLAVAGLVFALYLTYVEAFVLHAYCILCLTSLVTIVLIACLSMKWFLDVKRT